MLNSDSSLGKGGTRKVALLDTSHLVLRRWSKDKTSTKTMLDCERDDLGLLVSK